MPITNAYVINLDTHQERLEGFNESFSELNVTRFSGVDSSSLTEEQEELKRRYISPNSKLSNAEVGCFLSHLSLWKILVDSDQERMTIFEDDSRTLLKVEDINEYVDSVTEEYSILYLGKALADCVAMKKVEVEGRGRDRVYEADYVLCFHAYVITRETAEKLLSSEATASPIDLWVVNKRQELNLRFLVFHPSLVYQDVLNTTSSLRNDTSAIYNTLDCRPPGLDMKADVKAIATQAVNGVGGWGNIFAIIMAALVIIVILIFGGMLFYSMQFHRTEYQV